MRDRLVKKHGPRVSGALIELLGEDNPWPTLSHLSPKLKETVGLLARLAMSEVVISEIERKFGQR
jgi:hypothetical protein